MDNVIRVNVPNFVTVGLMAFVAVYLLNLAASKFIPAFALSTAASAPAPAESTGPVPTP